MTQVVSSVVPLLAPLPFDGERAVKRFGAFLAELPNDLGVSYWIGGKQADLRISVTDDPAQWSDLLVSWPRRHTARLFRFARLEAAVDIDPGDWTAPDGASLPASSGWRLDRVFAAGDLEQIVCDLVLAANIAKAGIVQTDEADVFVDGTRFGTVRSFHPDALGTGAMRALDLGWPPIEELETKQVLRWFRGLEGYGSGLPKGPAGRALATVSHLLAGSTELDLLWAVTGLEALYGGSHDSLAAQLIGKTRALFGEPASFKKRVSQMYDLRSRIVHGSVDLPLIFGPDVEDAHLEQYRARRSEAADTALALLLASLQRLVKEGGYEFNFSYEGHVQRRPEVVIDKMVNDEDRHGA